MLRTSGPACALRGGGGGTAGRVSALGSRSRGLSQVCHRPLPPKTPSRRAEARPELGTSGLAGPGEAAALCSAGVLFLGPLGPTGQKYLQRGPPVPGDATWCARGSPRHRVPAGCGGGWGPPRAVTCRPTGLGGPGAGGALPTPGGS